MAVAINIETQNRSGQKLLIDWLEGFVAFKCKISCSVSQKDEQPRARVVTDSLASR